MPAPSLQSFETGGGTLSFYWAPSPMVVAADYDLAANYLENMTAPLMASRQLGIADVSENFAGEHDPDGNPWAPWSESYIRSFGGKSGTLSDLGMTPDSILNLTGDLWESSTDARAWPITTREVFFDFGALPEYGPIHQEGASRASAGKGKSREDNIQATKDLTAMGSAPIKQFYGQNDLPARPFAGISEETTFLILDVFDNWFSGALSIGMGGHGTMQARVSGVDASGKKFGGRFGPKVGG